MAANGLDEAPLIGQLGSIADRPVPQARKSGAQVLVATPARLQMVRNTALSGGGCAVEKLSISGDYTTLYTFWSHRQKKTFFLRWDSVSHGIGSEKQSHIGRRVDAIFITNLIINYIRYRKSNQYLNLFILVKSWNRFFLGSCV